MKRSLKVAVVLVIAAALALSVLVLPLLPYQYVGSCIIQGGQTFCGPDHASGSFYIFGSGFMSERHGSSTYYSWCMNLGYPSYSCPHWSQTLL